MCCHFDKVTTCFENRLYKCFYHIYDSEFVLIVCLSKIYWILRNRVNNRLSFTRRRILLYDSLVNKKCIYLGTYHYPFLRKVNRYYCLYFFQFRLHLQSWHFHRYLSLNLILFCLSLLLHRYFQFILWCQVLLKIYFLFNSLLF